MTKINLGMAVAAILVSVHPLFPSDDSQKEEIMKNGYQYAKQLELLNDPDKMLEFMRNVGDFKSLPPLINKIENPLSQYEFSTYEQWDEQWENAAIVNHGNIFINYKGKGNKNVKK
jgi:hypothetical protein